jgi:hypothetical protein
MTERRQRVETPDRAARALRLTLNAVELIQRKDESPRQMHPSVEYQLDELYDHAANLYEQMKGRGKARQAAAIVERHLKI